MAKEIPGIFLLYLNYQKSVQGCRGNGFLSLTAVAKGDHNHVFLGREGQGAIKCEKNKVKQFVDCGSVKHVPQDET